MAGVKLSRKDLVRLISSQTLLKEEIVVAVLDSVVDIAIETLTNDDIFVLKNLVTLTPKTWGKTIVGNKDHKKELHQSKRVVATVSPTIRKLVTLQNTALSDKPGIINRNTWHGALKWYKEGLSGSNPFLTEISEHSNISTISEQFNNSYARKDESTNVEKQNIVEDLVVEEFQNPFLDDDDDEY